MHLLKSKSKLKIGSFYKYLLFIKVGKNNEFSMLCGRF